MSPRKSLAAVWATALLVSPLALAGGATLSP